MSGNNQPRVRWSQWFKKQLFQVVPDEIATCVFNCKLPECPDGGWEKCEKRLRARRDFSFKVD